MPSPDKRPHCSRLPLLWAGFLLLCLLSVPLACAVGAVGLDAAEVFRVLFSSFGGQSASAPGGLAGGVDEDMLRLIVLDLRLPRVILALLAGAGLGLAGAVFQAVLRNPLADPFTLGVSGGAAFGAALAISFGLTSAAAGFGLPLAAFAGGAAALFAVLMLGRMGGGLRHETLILAGVVVSAFLAALIALVKALDESSVTGIVFWIMGSFQGRGYADLFLFLPGAVLGGALALALPRELDMLLTGDGAARRLGLDTSRLRLLLLLGAGAVTASCVAVSGIIGFVGLIVPHLARMLLGAGHRRLLPASAFGGGLLLLWSDTAARSLPPGGVELPVGVITALLGGPFFCWILGKNRNRSAAVAGTRPYADYQDPAAPGQHSAGSAASSGGGDGFALCAPEARPEDSGTERAEAHVCCEGLCLRYGPHAPPALAGVEFGVGRGEFVGLLGPNGSGKSTLLACLAGLLRPASGAALVDGLSLASLPEKARARRVACLEQRPEAVPALAAFSLVLMGRYAHTPFLGGYGAHDRAVASAALAVSGAAALAARTADTLSGGELQSVLLARCLAQQCDLLLLDEATSGLDPLCRARILAVLARLNRDRGVTIIAAMHDLNLAAMHCSRLIFLKAGRVEADGPTAAVFTAATLRRVYGADFTVLPHPDGGRPQALEGARGAG